MIKSTPSQKSWKQKTQWVRIIRNPQVGKTLQRSWIIRPYIIHVGFWVRTSFREPVCQSLKFPLGSDDPTLGKCHVRQSLRWCTRECFLRWNSCFRIGWSDVGLTKRRTNAKGQWSVNVERNSNLKKAPDDPTHLSTRRRINTSDKWCQQLVWKLMAIRGISVGSDDPTPSTERRRIIRRPAQKKFNSSKTAS